MVNEVSGWKSTTKTKLKATSQQLDIKQGLFMQEKLISAIRKIEKLQDLMKYPQKYGRPGNS